MNWFKVSEVKPRPKSKVLCWDGHNFALAFYAEFGEPGSKPGEGEYIFNGCHWATHWCYVYPPKPPKRRRKQRKEKSRRQQIHELTNQQRADERDRRVRFEHAINK